MLELLEQIVKTVSILLEDDTISSNTDAVSQMMESEPEVLATSPSEGGSGASGVKQPKGDSEFCKKLTDDVLEMQRSSRFNLLSVAEHVDENNRKHVAAAAGAKIFLVGDIAYNGCISFPALTPAPSKK